MAQHYDTMDGPVVTAAELALEMENINYIVPYVKKDFEEELRDAFDKAIVVRELSGDAAEVADYWFFETAVRLYMLGEGKSYSGIKPSGLNWGPVIHKAEEAVETGDKTDLEEFLMEYILEEFQKHFEDVMAKNEYDINDPDAARDYLNAKLKFVLFSHELYKLVEKAD